jgi:hypothetical protein
MIRPPIERRRLTSRPRKPHPWIDRVFAQTMRYAPASKEHATRARAGLENPCAEGVHAQRAQAPQNERCADEDDHGGHGPKVQGPVSEIEIAKEFGRPGI